MEGSATNKHEMRRKARRHSDDPTPPPQREMTRRDYLIARSISHKAQRTHDTLRLQETRARQEDWRRTTDIPITHRTAAEITRDLNNAATEEMDLEHMSLPGDPFPSLMTHSLSLHLLVRDRHRPPTTSSTKDIQHNTAEMHTLRTNGFRRMLFESCRRISGMGQHDHWVLMDTPESWNGIETIYITTGNRGPLRAAWRRHCERLRLRRHEEPVHITISHHIDWRAFENPSRAHHLPDLNGVEQVGDTELGDMTDAGIYLATHARDRPDMRVLVDTRPDIPRDMPPVQAIAYMARSTTVRERDHTTRGQRRKHMMFRCACTYHPGTRNTQGDGPGRHH
jgi:hypothetical protein